MLLQYGRYKTADPKGAAKFRVVDGLLRDALKPALTRLANGARTE